MESSEAGALEKAGSLAHGITRTVNFILNQEAAVEGFKVGSDSNLDHILNIPSQLGRDLAMEPGQDRIDQALGRHF